MARAAALARSDVITGMLGDELEDVRGVEALLAGLIADELAAELTEDALSEPFLG